MRPHRLEPESTGTPHQLVLEHEQRLARRREEARRSATEVEKAKEEAARITADAARNAEVQGREQSEEILAAARAQAERITADGQRAAANLTATTRAREEADVAWVLDRVIPGRR
jgi:vacuolar-type H+-ATPase subunit H